MADLLLMRKRIVLDRSERVYDKPCTKAVLVSDWEAPDGAWHCRSGAFYGCNPNPAGGLLISRRGFSGPVMLDFYGQTVSPSTHDIDVMWNVSLDGAGLRTAYVAGIPGWWERKIGFERAPDNAMTALAPCPWFEPGREYHIQCGGIEGHQFVFIDGRLCLEMVDPHPIDSAVHNRVGFEAYQSQIRIRRLRIYRLCWETREQSYEPEF